MTRSPRRHGIGRVLLAGVVFALLFSGWSIGHATDATDPSSSDATTEATTSAPASVSPTETTSGVTAQGGGGGTISNAVAVRNLTDGRLASRVRSGIAHVTGGDAQNGNAAAAVSSCIDCRTVAVAIQIVLVQRTDASTIAPTNMAIAWNQQCLRCETFAAAYQYVLTTDGIVRFTAEGQRQLAAIENEIRALAATDGIPLPELNARISALVQQMWSVVDNELALVGVQGQGAAKKDVDVALEDSTMSPTPTPTETATESPAPETSEAATEPESPSPTPTEEPTPEDTPTPSESPSPTSSP